MERERREGALICFKMTVRSVIAFGDSEGSDVALLISPSMLCSVTELYN